MRAHDNPWTFVEESAQRETTRRIFREKRALRAELARRPGRPVTLEVTREALRLLRAHRWPLKVTRRARYLAGTRDYRIRVRVYAPPVEVTA